MEKILLLDTPVFILGYELKKGFATYFTVPQTREELHEGGFPRTRFDNAVMNKQLRVFNPESKFLEEVELVSAKLGEKYVLSKTDKNLLALGLQLKTEKVIPIIVTDDYSVQNVADKLGLRFISLSTSGIKRRFTWTTYCPGCKQVILNRKPNSFCLFCGSILRRKPQKKVDIYY